MGNPAGARASLEAAAPLREVDLPLVAALATATAELLAQEGDRDGSYRTVDEALRRLASTQDHLFRTELVVLGLRNEADRAGRRGAGIRPRQHGLTGWPPSSIACPPRRRTTSVRPPTTGRRPTSWPGCAAAPRPRLGGGRPGVAGCRAPPRGVQPAAADGVPCRRQAAGQGRDGVGRPGARPADRGGPDRGRRGRTARQDTAVDGACAPGALGGPALRADRAGVRGAATAGHRCDQPADRPGAVHQRAHGGVHVSRVLHKLQVTNRAQAAAVAVRIAR